MATKKTKGSGHSAYCGTKRPVRFPGYWMGHDADDLDHVPQPYPGPASRPTKNKEARPYER